MGQPNPFAKAPAPAPAPVPSPANATPSPFGAPTPPSTSPAPVTVAPTQNPATVDPSVDPQVAAYQAWLADQAAQAAQAAAAAAQVTAPAPVQPPVDPAYLAWQAQQAAATHVAPAPPVAAPVAQYAPSVPPAQFVAPPAAPSPATAPHDSSDPFDDPAPQRPRGPRLRDMYGRLLIIVPKDVESVSRRDPKTGETKVQDRLTADVVIVDEGQGPVAYGGEPEKLNGRPHDQVAVLPFRAANMYISAVGVISQCRDALAARKANNPRMVLGRLTVGESKGADFNPPYLLAPATPEDRARARLYTATIDPFAG